MSDAVLGFLVAASFVVGVAVAIGARELRRSILRRRSLAQHRALCRHLFANRPRARIVKVGRIKVGAFGPGTFRLDGWEFVPVEPVALSSYLFDGERDRELFLGWTIEELTEATKQPAEFEEAEAIR